MLDAQSIREFWTAVISYTGGAFALMGIARFIWKRAHPRQPGIYYSNDVR